VTEQNGLEVTSFREDDIELGQNSVDVSRYIDTHSLPKTIVEINAEVPNTLSASTQPKFQW